MTTPQRTRNGKFLPLCSDELRKWLINPEIPEYSRDIIASSTVISGFEWPSILMITGLKYPLFHVRNMIMRSMVKLVWLRTFKLEDIRNLSEAYKVTRKAIF